MALSSLILEFPQYKFNPVVCLDEHNLFVKSGITVIAALSGMGKTTYVQGLSDDWRREGFNVAHFNFDHAPCYEKIMLTPPNNRDGVVKMLSLICDGCDERDIIIFDSLKAMASYNGTDVESGVEMMPLMQEMRECCIKTGVSIILVHHVYRCKNVKSMPLSFASSSAIEEQCDSGFIFDRDKVTIVKSRAGYSRGVTVPI